MRYYEEGYMEKRTHYRMELNCPIQFKQPNDEHYRSGVCINLSATGLLMQASEHYPPGTQLAVQVSPQLSFSAPLQALIRVLRVESIPSPDAKDGNEAHYQFAGFIEEIM